MTFQSSNIDTAKPNSAGIQVSTKFVEQHTSLERYTLAWNVLFSILRRLRLDYSSLPGRVLNLILCLGLFVGVPIGLTILIDGRMSMPILTWLIIAIVFAVTYQSYGLYSAIGELVSSIARTVQDTRAIEEQIEWDKRWYRMRIAGVAGLLVASGIVFSISRSGTMNEIPPGTFFIIAVLSYQMGEIACNNLLMCFEARNFSKMKHKLYRFNPLGTPHLQRAIRGYNYFGLTTSIVMAVYVASSALLLPDPAYLLNPVWLSLILGVYMVVILGVLVPHKYIESIVKRTKERELGPLRGRLNGLFDRIDDLSDDEFSEMKRLEEVYQKVADTRDSSMAIETFIRLLGTLFIPTATFFLAVAGEVYLTRILETIWK